MFRILPLALGTLCVCGAKRPWNPNSVMFVGSAISMVGAAYAAYKTRSNASFVNLGFHVSGWLVGVFLHDFISGNVVKSMLIMGPIAAGTIIAPVYDMARNGLQIGYIVSLGGAIASSIGGTMSVSF